MYKRGDHLYAAGFKGGYQRIFSRKGDLKQYLNHLMPRHAETIVVTKYELVIESEQTVEEFMQDKNYMYLYKYNGKSYLVNAKSDANSKRILNERILFHTGRGLTTTELERLQYEEKETVTEG